MTVTLSTETALLIQKHLTVGHYPDVESVILAGLRQLDRSQRPAQEFEPGALVSWLDAGSESEGASGTRAEETMSVDEVFAELRRVRAALRAERGER